MLVYNIRKEKHAKKLAASGSANRWNKNDEFVIYTGSTRALSILELMAHRSGISVNSAYKLLVIVLDIDEKDIPEIAIADLPGTWQSVKSYPVLQEIGSNWYQQKHSLVLKAPSAIVPKEFNYLINTEHPDFTSRVILKEIEDFKWDKRLL